MSDPASRSQQRKRSHGHAHAGASDNGVDDAAAPEESRSIPAFGDEDFGASDAAHSIAASGGAATAVDHADDSYDLTAATEEESTKPKRRRIASAKLVEALEGDIDLPLTPVLPNKKGSAAGAALKRKPKPLSPAQVANLAAGGPFTCENCNRMHAGTYGIGRFCSSHCARHFSIIRRWDESPAKKTSPTASVAPASRVPRSRKKKVLYADDDAGGGGAETSASLHAQRLTSGDDAAHDAEELKDAGGNGVDLDDMDDVAQGESKEAGEGDEDDDSDPSAAAAAPVPEDVMAHLPVLSSSLRSKSCPAHSTVLVLLNSNRSRRTELWSLPYALCTDNVARTLMQLHGQGCNAPEREVEISTLWGRHGTDEQLGWRDEDNPPEASFSHMRGGKEQRDAEWFMARSVDTHRALATQKALLAKRESHHAQLLSAASTAAAAAMAAAQVADSLAAEAAMPSVTASMAAISAARAHAAELARSAATAAEAARAYAASPAASPSPPGRVYWGAHGWQRIDVLEFDDEKPAQKQQFPLGVFQHVTMVFHINMP